MTICEFLGSQVFNNALTVLALLLGICAYTQWKDIHVIERESQFYLQIYIEFQKLFYEILELRQPSFKPADYEEFLNHIKEIKIPALWNISERAYGILIQLSISDKAYGKKISELYKERFYKKIVKDKVTKSIHFFENNYWHLKLDRRNFKVEDTKLFELLYPYAHASSKAINKEDELTEINYLAYSAPK